MPNIDINGTVVNFPDDLTPQQLQQEASRAYAKMTQKPMDQNIAPSLGVDPGVPPMQKAMQYASAPFRGYRGAAVGLENLIAHPTQPNDALQRGAEATKVGFQTGKPFYDPESLAAMVGESVPLGPLAELIGAGSVGAQMLKQGALMGGYSAMNQTAEEGKPTLGRTALATTTGMAPPAVMGGAKAIFPAIAGKWTKTPKAAYEDLTTAFKTAFPGTSDAISGVTSKIVPTMEKAFKTVSDRLNSRKEFMGMKLSPKEALAEMEATGGEPRTLGRIASEFKDIQKKSAPFREVTSESKIVNKYGEPFRKTDVVRGISKGEKLRRLDDFSQDINKITEGSYPSDVLASKKAIEGSAVKTGGASYQILQKFKRQWGDLREIEKDLGSKLSDPAGAGKDFENIIRKSIEKPDKITSTDMIRMEAIQRLEKITGKPIIEPLRNQIKSSYTNTGLSDFVPKGMLGKILLMKYFPEGVASFLTGSQRMMGGVAQALNNPAGPIAKTAKTMAPVLASQLLRKQRERSQ